MCPEGGRSPPLSPMRINNLYISHQKFDWTKRHGLKFINSSNYHNSSGDCCTTVEDIGTELIDPIIDTSDAVHLIDLDLERIYDSHNLNSYARLFYKLTQTKKLVTGTDFLKKLTPDLFAVAHTRNAGPHIFAAGCSFTRGSGVPLDDRYISVVKKNLELPLVDLSQPGASILYSSDKILRSDIRFGDVVIWGISSLSRITVFNTTGENCYTFADYHRLSSSEKYWNINYFDSETIAFESIQSIERVKNFCTKLGAKLLLVNFLETSWIPLFYRDDPIFLDLHTDVYDSQNDWRFIDIGNDGIHPGPKQHHWYAQKILEHYARLY